MKKGLGRGLESLFALDEEESVNEEIKDNNSPKQEIKNENVKIENEISKNENVKIDPEDTVLHIDINLVVPNENQPRKVFDESSLLELANSIKSVGVIQPITVCKKDNGKYMIIAGERRWRASQLAKKETIPAIVKNYTDRQIAEVSLIENLQREDLNPIEAAKAIKKLMDEYDFTQETIADKIGKSRSAVANLLRLLNLYPEVIKMVENKEISEGHAKSLVIVDDAQMQIKLANMAKNDKLTVRALEKLVREYLNPKQKTNKNQQSIELKDMVAEMSRTFGTKVSVLGNDNKGRIYIDYYSKDDLNRIHEMLELIKEKKLTLKDLQNLNLKK